MGQSVDIRCPLRKVSGRRCETLFQTSYWLELSHMTTPKCKRGWEWFPGSSNENQGNEGRMVLVATS